MKMSIDGYGLRNMFILGANRLEKEKNNIDKLNVFPVPDGDTGTNMALTLTSATRELHNYSKDVDVEKVSKSMAHGALMGSRGNSGVILSQLLSGFAKSLESEQSLNSKNLSLAFQKGVDAAYSAVVKPIEGTILTVTREAAEALKNSITDEMSINEALNIFLTAGYVSLDRTPDLLPVLKQAGVVDAGGKGFLVFVEGMLEALGETIDIDKFLPKIASEGVIDFPIKDNHNDPNIKFSYCTETLIKNFPEDIDIDLLREKLKKLGDSLVVVGSDDLIKIHVHSNNPGKVLELGTSLGTLHNIKIDNMKEQNAAIQDHSKKKIGVIAVSIGDGLTDIFKSLGVDYIITGGQTMNPSTEDILNAIAEVNAENVIILPNNKNIILAAEQAVKITDKVSSIVRTRTVPQGIGALMAFNAENDLTTNVERMSESIEYIKTGEVTYAVRDSSTENETIKAGDILGIVEGEIAKVGSDIESVVLDIIEKIVEDEELITIYFGEDVKENEAEKLLDKISSEYPDIDFELHYGGQPLYYYFISAE